MSSPISSAILEMSLLVRGGTFTADFWRARSHLTSSIFFPVASGIDLTAQYYTTAVLIEIRLRSSVYKTPLLE